MIIGVRMFSIKRILLNTIIYFYYLVIEEANWLTLVNDVEHIIGDNYFDAVICLGNSFAHMTDPYGDQRMQKQAINNFNRCLKPGGLLLIDHRNYDYIIETGLAPTNCIYYNVSFFFKKGLISTKQIFF